MKTQYLQQKKTHFTHIPNTHIQNYFDFEFGANWHQTMFSFQFSCIFSEKDPPAPFHIWRPLQFSASSPSPLLQNSRESIWDIFWHKQIFCHNFRLFIWMLWVNEWKNQFEQKKRPPPWSPSIVRRINEKEIPPSDHKFLEGNITLAASKGNCHNNRR